MGSCVLSMLGWIFSVLGLSIRCVLFVNRGMFFFKQKTAYELRISDWSSDVCSSDLKALGKVPTPSNRPRKEPQQRRRHHRVAQKLADSHIQHAGPERKPQPSRYCA